MSQSDQLHRYLFAHRDVRGELVRVSDTWQHILRRHDYPPAVKKLLGELLVATSLLTATLKFAGIITIQLQGDGPVNLLVINGNHQQQMRGIARLADNTSIPDNASLKTLLGNGIMVITITPEQGERYQGIVALDADNLTGCLESYFLHSEQLTTRLVIRTGEIDGSPVAAGLLLQQLPSQQTSADDISHLAILTQTVTLEELHKLTAQDILWRLYHEEQVTLYPAQSVSFQCRCSRERCADMLKTLPEAEIISMQSSQQQIDIHCDYCGEHYLFNASQLAAIRQTVTKAHQP